MAELPSRLALALVHLDETLRRITELVALGRETVEGDPFLPLAAEQLGIRLGHDVEALPEQWRAERPAIPWHSIRGLRNRLAHDYHEIDFDLLWDAYAVAVPGIRAGLSEDLAAARAMVDPLDEEPPV